MVTPGVRHPAGVGHLSEAAEQLKKTCWSEPVPPCINHSVGYIMGSWQGGLDQLSPSFRDRYNPTVGLSIGNQC